MKLNQRNRRNSKGVALVEYALALGAIASATIFIFGSLGVNLGEVVEDLGSSFTVEGAAGTDVGAGGEPVNFVNRKPLVNPLIFPFLRLHRK